MNIEELRKNEDKKIKVKKMEYYWKLHHIIGEADRDIIGARFYEELKEINKRLELHIESLMRDGITIPNI